MASVVLAWLRRVPAWSIAVVGWAAVIMSYGPGASVASGGPVGWVEQWLAIGFGACAVALAAALMSRGGWGNGVGGVLMIAVAVHPVLMGLHLAWRGTI